MDLTQLLALLAFYVCSLLSMGAILPANPVVGGSHPYHSTHSHVSGPSGQAAPSFAARPPTARHDRIFKRDSSALSPDTDSGRLFTWFVDVLGADSVQKIKSQNHHCTKFNYSFPVNSYSGFKNQIHSALELANVLNSLFLEPPDSGGLDQDAYYYSLVKGVVASDDLIYGSAIAFDVDEYKPNSRTIFCPYAHRVDNQRLYVEDLGRSLHLSKLKDHYEWYWKQREASHERTYAHHNICKRVKEAGQDGSRQGYTVGSLVTKPEQGMWSAPHDGCSGQDHWLVTYSLPFFSCNEDNPLLKGVVAVDIDLQKVDVNQCDSSSDGNDPFAGTHRCKKTTECVHVRGRGFKKGSYECRCKADHFFPHSSNSRSFNGSEVEKSYREKLQNISDFYDGEQNYKCLPCASDCSRCQNETPCFAEYDVMMRGIPLGIQSFCMTISLVLAFVILRLRKTKVMKASMWMLLEIILGGALLLYSTVVIQYFKPSNNTCILIPWFREVGFAVVYGALLLKVYRVLAEFQSRKAHRVHVRDKDLLKYLCCIVLVVIGYMAAWTAVSMDHISEGNSMMETGTTPDQLSYNICKASWWDYVIELGEFLFLCFGVYLCYCIRAAPSDYLEAKYVSWAIYNETVASALLHITRHFLWLHIHPDYIFLMYFLRCQLTVTVTLILVLGPKLWYAHRPPEDDHFRGRTYSTSDVHDSILPESMKLHVGVNSNGDVDVGEINLSEMDPEDIRVELKRLYTQLQIYKTKTMRKDNPHISKRRGGRKQTHRRFSLQAFHHKHRHHHSDHDHEHEMSKTPEESTNSAEGVAISMAEESSVGEIRTPTVTFKPGHKSLY